MRDAEEVAREVECVRVGTALGSQCDTHGQSWPCNDSAVRYLAAYIRARDAEVAAKALRDAAGVLADRTEGPSRAGVARWPDEVQAAYSLAIEEASGALRTLADEREGGASDADA